MQIQNESELISFQGWSLRTRRAASTPSRLLLLIHGRTGDENSMWVFVHKFPSDYWMIAPRAPQTVAPSGFSWLPSTSYAERHTGLDDFRIPAQALLTLLDAYASPNGLDDRRFDVIGFSEGAALAATLALICPQRIRRLALLAGFVPHGAEEVIALRPLEGMPVFVAHGTLDELVGIDRARQSAALLERLGAHVSLCEAEIGHKVSAGCLRSLETFFV